MTPTVKFADLTDSGVPRGPVCPILRATKKKRGKKKKYLSTTTLAGNDEKMNIEVIAWDSLFSQYFHDLELVNVRVQH